MSYTYTALEKLKDYNGKGWHVALFVLALVFLWLGTKEKEHKKLFTGYSILFAILYFCPVTAKIIMKFCVEEQVYWRMLWLLPIPLVLAYAGVQLIRKFSKKMAKAGVFLLLAAVLIAGGNNMYIGTGGRLEKASNINKIPQVVCSVCEVILQDQNPESEKKVVMAESLVGYVRQYTPKIILAFGRWGPTGKNTKILYNEMTAEKPNFKEIKRLSLKYGYEYLVYGETREQDAALQKIGYVKIGQINEYGIYRLDSTEGE